MRPTTRPPHRALLALTALLAHGALTACADAGADDGLTSDTEKRAVWETWEDGGAEGYGEGGAESLGDEETLEWWSDDSGADSGDEVVASDTSSDPSTSDGGLPEVRFGGACAPGCVWSAYAVRSFAQEAEATCEGFLCACVLSDDVSVSCEPSDPSAPAETTPDTGSAGGGSTGGGTSGGSNDYNGTYDAYLGSRIADAAYRQAQRRNTVGYCYGAVADAVESVVGAFLYGESAYMAADQLARHPRFAEISAGDLRSLPAGAVVVWGRGTSRHGHISVALGDGREASDHIAAQMTAHYGGAPARVFLPR